MSNYETHISHMIDNLESGMFGVTATEMLLPPTWHKWYVLTDDELNNWNDMSGIGEVN